MRHQLLSGLSWKLILSESIFMCDFYLWRHFILSPLLKETQRWPGLPWGMWSWQALLWSAGTRESYWRTYASSPGAPIHNMWICTLCTHTQSHTAPCTCAHALTQKLSPPSDPTKLLLCSSSLLSPIKNRQDKSITSPTRALSSSWLPAHSSFILAKLSSYQSWGHCEIRGGQGKVSVAENLPAVVHIFVPCCVTSNSLLNFVLLTHRWKVGWVRKEGMPALWQEKGKQWWSSAEGI